jgi:hypothetical protein
LTDFSSLQLKSIVVQGNVKRKMRDNNEIIRKQVLFDLYKSLISSKFFLQSNLRRVASDETAKFVLIEDGEGRDFPRNASPDLMKTGSPPVSKKRNRSEPNGPSNKYSSKRHKIDENPAISLVDMNDGLLPSIPGIDTNEKKPSESPDDSFADIEWADQGTNDIQKISLSSSQEIEPIISENPSEPTTTKLSNPLDSLFPGVEDRDQAPKKIFIPLDSNPLESSFDRVLKNFESEAKPIEINSSFEVLEISKPSPSKPKSKLPLPSPIQPTKQNTPMASNSQLPPSIKESNSVPKKIQSSEVASESAEVPSDRKSLTSAVPRPAPKIITLQDFLNPTRDKSTKEDKIDQEIPSDKELVEGEEGRDEMQMENNYAEPEEQIEELEEQIENEGDEELEEENEADEGNDESLEEEIDEDELSQHEWEQRQKSRNKSKNAMEEIIEDEEERGDKVIEIESDEGAQGGSIHPYFVGHRGVNPELGILLPHSILFFFDFFS